MCRSPRHGWCWRRWCGRARGSGPPDSRRASARGSYLLNQTQMIVRYLRLAVWPRGLVVDYGAPRADDARRGGAVRGCWCWRSSALTIWALVRKPDARLPRRLVLHDAVADLEHRADRDRSRRRAAHVSCRSRRSSCSRVIGLAWLLERYVRLQADDTRDRDAAVAHDRGARALAVVALALAAGTVVRNRELRVGRLAGPHHGGTMADGARAARRWVSRSSPRGRHEEGINELRKARRRRSRPPATRSASRCSSRASSTKRSCTCASSWRTSRFGSKCRPRTNLSAARSGRQGQYRGGRSRNSGRS